MTQEQFDEKQRAISNSELAEMAQQALSKLCRTGGKSFIMTIPPRIDDTDMVISELIRRFKETGQAKNISLNPDVNGTLPLAVIRETIQTVKDAYPTDVFPENGKSQDCKSAMMARVICENILEKLEEVANGNFH